MKFSFAHKKLIVSCALLALPAAGVMAQASSKTGTSPAEKHAPQRIPAPAPATKEPYKPQPILPGGIVVPLYAPQSARLNKERLSEAEKYTLTDNVPGRIQAIVNVHNPSIEVHRSDPRFNTGAAVILVPGGGHNVLVTGTEGGDFVPWFFNYGVNTIILRYRLRSDGYKTETDAVNDLLQAIRLVRANAKEWGIDPAKIGIIGFSAGAELAGTAAVAYDKFDQENKESGSLPAKITSRPDFVGLLYPGPTPFTTHPETKIPGNVPPAFIASPGSGDQIHAIWATDYFRAMLEAGVPNIEMHIYGNGTHADGLKDRGGIPYGTWHDRYIDWMRDLGFLQQPGIETKAAKDVAAFVKDPPKPYSPQH